MVERMGKSKPRTVVGVDDFRKALRDAGLRSTAARIAVLEHLSQSKSPLTHADLADILEPMGFDRATAYRNLVDMTEAGLLTRTELGDHVWRFELRRPGHDHDNEHPHFVCVDCGEVSCLPDVEVNITPTPGTKRSGIGDVTEILLRGHCGRCG
jgi:Fur family ferric uptake transcriptional regulator